MADYVSDLRAIGAGAVRSDVVTLDAMSHDESLFRVEPKVVIEPRTPVDVAKIVRFVADRKAKEKNISITARGAGTCLSGGPLGESIILDASRYLTHVGPLVHDDGEATMSVESGVAFKSIDTILADEGFMFAPFPRSRDDVTIGGMVGNNAAGEYSLHFGPVSDNIKGVEMVLADGSVATFSLLSESELEEKKKLSTFEGDIYRKIDTLIQKNAEIIKKAKPNILRNASGYPIWDVSANGVFDLTKLIAGSQGTLGIVTKTTLQVVPIFPAEISVVATLRSIDVLPELTSALLRESPVSLEVFDENILSLAGKYMPDEMLGIAVPDGTALIVVARYAGDIQEEVAQRAERAIDIAMSYGVTDCFRLDKDESVPYWHVARSARALLKKHASTERTAASFIDDIVVPVASLHDFLVEFRAILPEYFLAYSTTAHVGEGNIHIIPFIDMRNTDEHARILEIADRAYALARAYGGSSTASYNDGIIRSPFVEDRYGHAVYKIFQDIKQIFDPQNIFNPGKKVNGSLSYALKHFVKNNRTNE